jgi:hypothetical protein
MIDAVSPRPSGRRQYQREVRSFGKWAGHPQVSGLHLRLGFGCVGLGLLGHMSAPIASAAVAEAHRHHQLVFTHSTNLEGTRVAMDSGVDVLAHAPEVTDGLDDRLLQNLVARHMAMIPTLKLLGDADIASIRSEVFSFHRLGGVLMFGTDILAEIKDDGAEEEEEQEDVADAA